MNERVKRAGKVGIGIFLLWSAVNILIGVFIVAPPLVAAMLETIY